LTGSIFEIAAFGCVAKAHRCSPACLRLQCATIVTVAIKVAGRNSSGKGDSLHMKLQGKTALVTGSTSGIGLAIARALAFEGASVMINGFGDADEIEEIRRELEASSGAQALYDAADLSDAGAIEAMIRRCGHELTAPDILVNNAGIQHVAPVDQFPVDKWDAILAINLSAVFHTTRLTVGSMKQKQWGRIINTASAHSLVASPNKSAYVAAKHGVAGFTKSVALEAAKDGVTVNCISPGYVWTTLVENQIPDTMKARGLTREQVMNDVLLAAQPTKRFVTPEEVAALALFLCRDEAKSITGANLSMDGGWTAA
jgi:3-hydroxybutyrate dehydrogenase